MPRPAARRRGRAPAWRRRRRPRARECLCSWAAPYRTKHCVASAIRSRLRQQEFASNKQDREVFMRLFAVTAMALCAIGWSGLAQAQNAKLCDKPRQMEGFKTCADVEKAEAEGAFVLYSTDPEPGQAKLVGAFMKAFPKIKAN